MRFIPRRTFVAFITSSLLVLGSVPSHATTFVEPFTGYPNYASGLIVKQNNAIIGTSGGPGVGYATSTGFYLYCVYSDVVFTFPSSQSVTSFSFDAINVGGAQPLQATYKDGSVVNFSISAAAGINNMTTTVTFNGDGRAILSFSVVGMAVQSCNVRDPAVGLDVWLIGNLSWNYNTSTSTSISISGASTATYRVPYVITASLGVAGSDGRVYFYADGKKIANCNPKQSSGLTATCRWLPSRRGLVSISTILKPSSAGFTESTSSNLKILVGNRATSR